MLRLRILGASLAALASGIGAAAAADLGVYSPPPETYAPASAWSWTGPYVGGIIGYGWGNASAPGVSWDADGITGGVYAGYNFQPDPNLVVGVEGDITASGMEGSSGGGPSVDNPWNSTIRARAGFSFDRSYSPDGSLLAVGGAQGMLGVFDAS